jgi:hypothetical protein
MNERTKSKKLSNGIIHEFNNRISIMLPHVSSSPVLFKTLPMKPLHFAPPQQEEKQTKNIKA